jgi:hypothetical protein
MMTLCIPKKVLELQSFIDNDISDFDGIKIEKYELMQDSAFIWVDGEQYLVDKSWLVKDETDCGCESPLIYSALQTNCLRCKGIV